MLQTSEEYYEQLHAQIYDSLDEVNQFFEKHKIPQLINYEII